MSFKATHTVLTFTTEDVQQVSFLKHYGVTLSIIRYYFQWIRTIYKRSKRDRILKCK